MSSGETTQRGGIGFVGLLTIVFITLKLTGVISWSWLWVLAPIWISAALSLVALLILGIIMLFLYLGDKRDEKKWRANGKR